MFPAEGSKMRGPKEGIRAYVSEQRGPSKGIPAVRTEWKDSSEGIRAEGSKYWRDPS